MGKSLSYQGRREVLQQVAPQYQTCAKFVTTPAYAPRRRRRRRIEQELVEDARQHGWQREVERHHGTIRRIEQLLADLGESLDGPEARE